MVEVTIRGFMKDGEPWFVAKDVTDALGYTAGFKAVTAHVDEDQKATCQIGRLGGKPNTIISEGGLYALIMGSKLPQAREFRRWVLDTVLPSIRKNGGYLKDQEKVVSGVRVGTLFRGT
ncbi:MAG: BRO family protein [Hyphomicrobiales bacterium]|nr:BRO family protein [Hyphomicrobiales bacterium]